MKTIQRLLENVLPIQPEEGETLYEEHERIRVILACRSRGKAEIAVAALRLYFSDRMLLLEIEELDLCCMKNVEEFCGRVLDRYLFGGLI
jgi:hypothetical protein